jgi:hypothetical protein
MQSAKDQAIEHLEAALVQIRLFGPTPEPAPGPEQTNAGKAYQAMATATAALSWMESIKDGSK